MRSISFGCHIFSGPQCLQFSFLLLEFKKPSLVVPPQSSIPNYCIFVTAVCAVDKLFAQAMVCMYVCMYVWSSHVAIVWINRVRLPILLVVSQTGKKVFPQAVPLRAWEFCLARRVWQYRSASACSSPCSGWILCLVTGSLPSSAVASIYLFKLSYVIGLVPSLSGHAIAYRWRLLPRVRRHRANKPQGSSKRVLPWQVTMNQ